MNTSTYKNKRKRPIYRHFLSFYYLLFSLEKSVRWSNPVNPKFLFVQNSDYLERFLNYEKTLANIISKHYLYGAILYLK